MEVPFKYIVIAGTLGIMFALFLNYSQYFMNTSKPVIDNSPCQKLGLKPTDNDYGRDNYIISSCVPCFDPNYRNKNLHIYPSRNDGKIYLGFCTEEVDVEYTGDEVYNESDGITGYYSGDDADYSKMTNYTYIAIEILIVIVMLIDIIIMTYKKFKKVKT